MCYDKRKKGDKFMKKFKFIVCSVAAVLAISACTGGNKKNKELPAGELPEGGTVVDIKTEQGKADIYNELMSVIDAYTGGEFTAIGLKSETKNVNIGAKVNVKEEQEEGDPIQIVDVDASLTNFGATIEAKIAGDDESWQGQVSLSGLSGDLKAKVDAMVDEDATISIDDSLSFKDVGAEAYLTGSAVYVDASGAGLRQLLTDAGPIVNKVLKQSGLLPVGGVSIDLNELIDGFTGAERKFYIPVDLSGFNPIALLNTIQMDDEDKPSEADWLNTAAVIEQIPFIEFKSYEDGRFGIGTHVTKQGILDVVAKIGDEDDVEDVTESLQVLPELDVKAALVIRANGLIDSLSIGGSFKLDIQDEDDGTLTDAKVSASLEERLSLMYNDEVKLSIPSQEVLDTYQQLNTEALGD